MQCQGTRHWQKIPRRASRNAELWMRNKANAWRSSEKSETSSGREDSHSRVIGNVKRKKKIRREADGDRSATIEKFDLLIRTLSTRPVVTHQRRPDTSLMCEKTSYRITSGFVSLFYVKRRCNMCIRGWKTERVRSQEKIPPILRVTRSVDISIL